MPSTCTHNPPQGYRCLECNPLPTIPGISISELGDDDRTKDLKGLITVLLSALGSHDDNCGGPCRHDLNGHDCCAICNLAEDMVLSFIRIKAEYDS